VNKRPPRNNEVLVKKQNTLLVDGNALFKNGFFGAKNEYNNEGVHIGGIYSFLTILRKILTEDLYHRVYVFWDGNYSGKLRYEIYEPYKSGRGKDYINGTQPIDEDELIQRIKVRNYLNDMYVRQLINDVIESDDFIAYYCLNRKENEKITIVSSDRDFVQLLNKDIRIYFLDLKEYVDLNNYYTYFSYHPENAVLMKTMIGDTSDSIKGIKGLGETKLLSLFPELKERKVTLDEVIEMARNMQENRLKEKKKPMVILDNIINKVTDGVQKEMIYEINEKLVNLHKPMMTENGLNEIHNLMDGTLSSTGRDLKNVFNLMKEDGLDKTLGERRFEEFLLPFKKLIPREEIF
jgi:DNA polymerase I